MPQKLGTQVVVVKAQIHAGGRGKGGGVKLARSADEAAPARLEDAGHERWSRRKRAPAAASCKRLLIEEGLDIKRELYLSILVDRAVEAPVIMASAAGGMEIEEVGTRKSRRHPARDDSSRHRPAALSCCASSLLAWASRREHGPGRRALSCNRSIALSSKPTPRWRKSIR